MASLNTDTGRQIRFQSYENHIFTVDLDVAIMSSTVKTILEDWGDDDYGDNIIPLPNVKSDTLGHVIEWCTHHRNNPRQTEDADDESADSRSADEWDKDFVKDIGQPALFDLILAANYLDIKGLLDVTCKTVANMMKGKSPEDVRVMFNITNDLSPAEQEQIRKENEWCEVKEK